MPDASDLKVPTWWQASFVVMALAIAPSLGACLTNIVQRFPAAGPLQIILTAWYLFVLGIQFQATFQRSSRATIAAMYATGLSGIVHLLFFAIVLFYSGYIYAISSGERWVAISSIAYFPATSLLFFAMIGLNYHWLGKLIEAFGREGPRHFPPLVTLRRIFGLIAYIAVVIGSMMIFGSS